MALGCRGRLVGCGIPPHKDDKSEKRRFREDEALRARGSRLSELDSKRQCAPPQTTVARHSSGPTMIA
jgi:hypothetical protein